MALGIPSDIERAIDLNYRSSGEIEKQVSQFTKPLDEEVDVTSKVIAKTPIAQSLDLLIQQAVRDRASDVHLEPNERNLRVRYRIDGILQEMFSLPLNAHVPLLSRIKILAEMNIADNHLQFWNKLAEAANDPWIYGNFRMPSLVFTDIVVSGL